MGGGRIGEGKIVSGTRFVRGVACCSRRLEGFLGSEV